MISVITFPLDVNECKTGSHACQHHCINKLGMYSCSCNIGYVLAGNKKSCNRKYYSFFNVSYSNLRQYQTAQSACRCLLLDSFPWKAALVTLLGKVFHNYECFLMHLLKNLHVIVISRSDFS